MNSRNTQVLQPLHSTSVIYVAGDTMDLRVFKYKAQSVVGGLTEN
jgi:hypothetical protein